MIRPRLFKKKFRPVHPDAQAGRYLRLLNLKLDLVRQAIYQYVMPYIDIQAARSTDAVLDDLSDAIKDARSMVSQMWDKKNALKELQGVGRETSLFGGKHLAKRFVDAPDDIGKEAWVQEEVRRWSLKTNTYVDAISDDLFEQLKAELAPKIEQGARWEELVDVIEERLQATDSRAETIARTEIAHFNTELNKTRQVDLGATEYIWRTMNDSKVRDSHAALDGQQFSWLGDGDPEEGHPGETPNCRCFPEPVISEYSTEPSTSDT